MEEVEILGSINHSQIMRLYRVFADMEDSLNDEIVLLLEYLSGSSYFLCFLQAQYQGLVKGAELCLNPYFFWLT